MRHFGWSLEPDRHCELVADDSDRGPLDHPGHREIVEDGIIGSRAFVPDREAVMVDVLGVIEMNPQRLRLSSATALSFRPKDSRIRQVPLLPGDPREFALPFVRGFVRLLLRHPFGIGVAEDPIAWIRPSSSNRFIPTVSFTRWVMTPALISSGLKVRTNP